MKLYNLTYFLRESIQSIFSHRLMSIAAMSVITACLILMGSFSLVAVNIDALLEDIENQNEIVVFIDEEMSREAARAMEGELLSIEEVATAVFMTKEDALENFKKEFGDEAAILDGLDERNPLRDRFTITLHSIHDTQKAAEKLEQITGIANVRSRSDITDKIIQVRDVTTAICTMLILILVFVSVFIISNTVNITMFNRREEIAIMKMIGATNSFVRIPFVIEGILIGLAGASVALLLQWGVYEYVVASALSTISFIPTASFGELIWLILIMFYGVGILVGGLGSAITLRKFLKV